MDQWILHLDEDDGPRFLQLAKAIVRDVRRGRLKPGDALPGSRRMATELKMHRNTVLAGLRELANEGWIETLPARGTFIAHDLPEPELPVPKRSAPSLGFDVAPTAHAWTRMPPGALPLLGGVPDLRLVPRVALARALRRAVHRRGVLGYGDPAGTPRLRAALAERLTNTRGLAIGADDLMVTRGSQMALHLLAQVLLSPGDIVLVEALGYPPAWAALRASGAVIRPIPLDSEGIRVDRVEAALEKETVRAIYLTPHHQYPTTVTLPAARRLALLRLAARHRVAIIEDDYDHEFHYDGQPILPLAARDRDGVVVHVGTFSKVLAPALRLGWVVAPPPLREALVAARVHIDRQGDALMEHALTELLEDGEVQRHALRMRRAYRDRRDTMVGLLRERLGSTLRFDVPRGGMALWARVRGIDVDAWAARAEAEGVLLQTARRFTFDGRPRQAMRLGFAALTPSELEKAVDILAGVL